jgi:hypothetical protein
VRTRLSRTGRRGQQKLESWNRMAKTGAKNRKAKTRTQERLASTEAPEQKSTKLERYARTGKNWSTEQNTVLQQELKCQERSRLYCPNRVAHCSARTKK